MIRKDICGMKDLPHTSCDPSFLVLVMPAEMSKASLRVSNLTLPLQIYSQTGYLSGLHQKVQN